MRRSPNKVGYTQVDHTTFDLILPLLSPAAQSVFLRIYRQTYGWKKETDKIATSQFTEWCNIKKRETIKKAIDELLKLNLITAEGKRTQVKEFGIKWETINCYRQRHLESLEDHD